MQANPIELVQTSVTEALELLQRHPHVLSVEYDSTAEGLVFWREQRRRHIGVGNVHSPLKGLVELMDNNPLVCADEFSVPDAASTLALITLGPVAGAGLLLEDPVFITNLPASEGATAGFLATQGYAGGVTLAHEEAPLAGLAMATAIASIETPSDPSELDALYAEHYERSFCVELGDQGEWRPEAVLGTPLAFCSLRFSPGEDGSLLTVKAMADVDGKCGAGQLVHAMNVMAGFEESLGLRLSRPVSQ